MDGRAGKPFFQGCLSDALTHLVLGTHSWGSPRNGNGILNEAVGPEGRVTTCGPLRTSEQSRDENHQLNSQMLDDANIEAFTGSNSDYYRVKWQRFHDKPDSVSSFNAAACFGQIVWLAYRKLYMPLFVATALGVADVALVLYVGEHQLVSPYLMTTWNLSVAVFSFAVFGFFGNYWYWVRFRKMARQADAHRLDRRGQAQFLRSRGGTSPLGAGALVVLLLMPFVWVSYQVVRVDLSGFVFDATGPLTLAEVRANLIDRMDTPLEEERRECVFREVEERARAAGDPETLDPATVEFLPVEGWHEVDPFGRRIVLAQVIVTKALFVCD